MITKILSLILIAFTLFTAAPALAVTDANNKVFAVCATNPSATVCKEKNPSEDPVVHVIRTASTIVALLTGAMAVIFIILGGITMITSNGSPEAVANARKRVIYALIGLIIVALAWTLIAFVTDKLIQ
jgi:predicted small integral membrane protein